MAKSTDERLDEHSKKIMALEAGQAHFGREQSDIKRTLDSIRDYIFGSLNPSDVSMKEQVKQIGEIVAKIETRLANEAEETGRIRTDGFQRLKKLEEWQTAYMAAGLDKRTESRKWLYGVVFFALGILTRYIP